MNGRGLTADEAIEAYLSNLQQRNGRNYFSGFNAGLRDSRQATGRNIETGQKIDGENHGSWLGAMGYVAILDQLGKTLKPSGATQATGSNIGIALSYFTSLSEAERSAIYALRCAFTHDFSLINPNNRRPILQHHFTVSQGDRGDLVVLPATLWDGDIQSFNQANTTYVNLELLGDMVEGIYRDLLEMHYRSELEITLAGGPEELITRYMIVSPP